MKYKLEYKYLAGRAVRTMDVSGEEFFLLSDFDKDDVVPKNLPSRFIRLSDMMPKIGALGLTLGFSPVMAVNGTDTTNRRVHGVFVHKSLVPDYLNYLKTIKVYNESRDLAVYIDSFAEAIEKRSDFS